MHKAKSIKLANKRDWLYMELGGMHDDVWENPVVYVDLILKQIAG